MRLPEPDLVGLLKLTVALAVLLSGGCYSVVGPIVTSVHEVSGRLFYTRCTLEGSILGTRTVDCKDERGLPEGAPVNATETISTSTYHTVGSIVTSVHEVSGQLYYTRCTLESGAMGVRVVNCKDETGLPKGEIRQEARQEEVGL